MSDQSMDLMANCARLSDVELVRELRFLAERARHNEIRLLAHLAEFDARRLCLEEGFRSLYEYCTGALGFEEGESYRRIRAARVVRAFPQAMSALEKKRVSVSSLVVLSPWLERDNVSAWLKAAEGRTRRELEGLVAARYPQAPQPDAVRRLPARPMIVAGAPPCAVEAAAPAEVALGAKLPESSPDIAEGAGAALAAARLEWGWQLLTAVSVDRVRVGFDAASVVAHLIERARQILRHKYPEGRLEDLIREALETLLDHRDPQRRLELKAHKAGRLQAGAAGPVEEKASSEGVEADRLPTRFLRSWAAGRYIPARVKSAVWQRDGGRCAWRERDGTVCGSKDWLEYDHVRPFAKGGRSDDARNVRLLCRLHNQAAAQAAGLVKPLRRDPSGPAQTQLRKI